MLVLLLRIPSCEGFRSDRSLIVLRGGSSKSKKKRRKGSKRKAKTKISDTLEKNDVADALGDAIRQNPQGWLQADSESPVVNSVDSTLQSLRWSLGASDYNETQHLIDGGVEGAPSSVILQYFLKSHGGVHGWQCLCSLFCTLAGTASLATGGKVSLLRRSLWWAMLKHVTGLVAASALAAKTIPEIGLSQTRQWLEHLARDPVSQYVFYTACIWLWALPAVNNPMKWQSYSVAPWLLLGPVLIREVISTLMVIRDVLVLWSVGGSQEGTIVSQLFEWQERVVTALMSLLFTPKAWRGSSRSEQQALLAGLTAKLCLGLEVAVGVLMSLDAGSDILQWSLGQSKTTNPLGRLAISAICTKLYIDFLWTRRQKYQTLATQVRGGASELPLYLLGVMLDPLKSMGIELSSRDAGKEFKSSSSTSWKDYLWEAFKAED